MEMMPLTSDAGWVKTPGPATEPTFRLLIEKPEALSVHANEIERLASESLDANPFYLPAFLGPAIKAFGDGEVELALFYAGTRLVFFAPILCAPLRRGALRMAQIWSHNYGPLGVPLLDRARGHAVASALFAKLADAGIELLMVSDIPALCDTWISMRRAADGRVHTIFREERAILTAELDALQDFEREISPRRHKDMGRLRRRLEEVGPVEFSTATGAALRPALDDFLTLEAAGWKGRRGTAILTHVGRRFAEDAILALGASDAARIERMTVGGKLAASSITLVSGSLLVPWKIAFDESFSRFSPGVQLLLRNTRLWLSDPTIARIDPVSNTADARLLAHYWHHSEPYEAAVLEVTPSATRARLARSTEHGRWLLRRQARAVRDRLQERFGRS
ncbi:CelD/BcsL family acetyltransferase involved in cellulose biosynthesis [Rhodopseudomonas julia]|uniref:CelD/BcsL family acetyltransferase involved in cellulose biosynthesis n=1 Tax=Rhodopseudomonas julia TaxID=200617 RepID=A0ABU0C5K7_9BRAD|nr:GNAT family N-acetyltransferase [Rhodopseudomonas julia]MDQ0325796.1 CelD/BcsL family acetyltransferase involved in cellulose biosynthesis [Rhodopseudomonas julia]